MAGLTNKQKKEWAYTEYVTNNLSQKEVAEKVGTTTVTMTRWVRAGNWDEIRRQMLVTRDKQLGRLYAQFDELTRAIELKEEGKRYADSKEADTLNKLTSAIRSLETEASVADIVEVSKRLLNWLRPIDAAKSIEISGIFNDFIKHSLKG
ncbi:DDE transposase family protein [Maribellus mangrovi]|uniref:DDE transposase family protein n=1 Tax=Maribellus mangrovi TaxID=3133146 RepID=UPI0030EB82A0